MRLVLVLLLTAVVAGPFDAHESASGLALAQGGGAAVQPPQEQTPAPPQQPIFRAGAELVRVDVTATINGDEPVADLQASDFEVTEDDVPQTVETIKFVRVDGTRTSNLDEPLEIRSKDHAILEAAREDVRLFAIFLDDYHIDKRPDITLPLRETLTKFVKQLGPNDLVALMEPLTTLYDLKYTRAKDELGALLAVGVISMLCFCVVVNIGMTAGMFPIVGIPLPLMSYGGSATIMTMASLGLLLNVKRRRLSLFY